MGVEIPELCPGRVFDMCNALEMESQRAFRIIMLQDADMCPQCNIEIASKFCGDCGTRSARILDASMMNELGSALAASLRDVQIIGCTTDKGEEVENEDDWDALRSRFAEMATASSIKEESESDEELVATIGEIVHVSITDVFHLQPRCSRALRNGTTPQTLTSLIKRGRHDPMKDDFLILNAAMANVRLSRAGGKRALALCERFLAHRLSRCRMVWECIGGKQPLYSYLFEESLHRLHQYSFCTVFTNAPSIEEFVRSQQ